ncbi:MAG: hypothetical protein LBS99_00400, partial [Clostridiales bacterium]|nr:hypothetical protein [Clostridiales bacterium]
MKKLKKLTLLITAAVLAMSCALGSLSLFVSAAQNASSSYTAFGNLPGIVDIGDEITLPAALNALVTDPFGKTVTVTAHKFTPALVGYYSIDFYGPDNFVYKGYKINVTATDAQLTVAFNGADIPSYADIGASFTLPAASMVVYDDDGELDVDATDEANADFTISVKITDPNGASVTITDFSATQTLAVKGTYFVRYIAALSGTTVKLTKDFTVKVQEGFEDKEKPVLSVLNVPTEGNYNVKVTLPKATATDNFDENVKITVKVTNPDGTEVKTVNDDDPKALVLGTDAVKFDNDKTMSFYPWATDTSAATGTYKVTYTANDDVYKSGEPQNKVVSSFDIIVSDKKAPTIEIEDNVIPTSWAGSVIAIDPLNPTDTDGKQLSGEDAL